MRRHSTATLTPITQGIYQPNYFAHLALDAEAVPNNVVRKGQAILAIEIAPPSTPAPRVTDARAAILKGCPYVRFNLADLKYTIVQPGKGEPKSGDKLDDTVIRSFLIESGVDVANEDLENAAKTLARSIWSGRAHQPYWSAGLGNLKPPPFSIQSEFSHFGPASPVRLPGLSSFATWTLIVAIAFIVLFILALRFVIRRRRRLLTAPVNQMVATPTPPAPAAPPAHS